MIEDGFSDSDGAKCGHHLHRVVKPYQRKQLLERIEREGATVGARIPDEIEIQGETINLQQFVFEIKRRETVPASDRDRVEQAKRNLRRERRQRVEVIENNEISYETGQDHVNAVVGIDRALNALEQLEPVDLEAETKRKQAADKKRWTKFLKKALGHEDESKKHHR